MNCAASDVNFAEVYLARKLVRISAERLRDFCNEFGASSRPAQASGHVKSPEPDQFRVLAARVGLRSADIPCSRDFHERQDAGNSRAQAAPVKAIVGLTVGGRGARSPRMPGRPTSGAPPRPPGKLSAPPSLGCGVLAHSAPTRAPPLWPPRSAPGRRIYWHAPPSTEGIPPCPP